MKLISSLVIVSTLAMGATALAGKAKEANKATKEKPKQSRYVAAINCDEASDTATMNRCAEASYAAADKELNRVWTAAKSSNTNSSNSDLSLQIWQRLVVAQKAWIAFRDAHCSADASNIGGTGETVEILGCKVQMTRERTTYLEKWLDSSGSGY